MLWKQGCQFKSLALLIVYQFDFLRTHLIRNYFYLTRKQLRILKELKELWHTILHIRQNSSVSNYCSSSTQLHDYPYNLQLMVDNKSTKKKVAMSLLYMLIIVNIEHEKTQTI